MLQELLQLVRLLVLLALALLRRLAVVALRRVQGSDAPRKRLVLALDVLGDLPGRLHEADLDGGVTLQKVGESLLLRACHILQGEREGILKILRALFLRRVQRGHLTCDLLLHHRAERARVDAGTAAEGG